MERGVKVFFGFIIAMILFCLVGWIFEKVKQNNEPIISIETIGSATSDDGRHAVVQAKSGRVYKVRLPGKKLWMARADFKKHFRPGVKFEVHKTWLEIEGRDWKYKIK